jgi:hypothetical protein
VNRDAWLRRLNAQLPGWTVWYSSGSLAGSGYFTAPAPGDLPKGTNRLGLANRLGPYRDPKVLRAEARERYGWDDHCDTCGVLARDCGHHRPETRNRRDS